MPRRRRSDSMAYRSNRARSSPVCALLGLLVRSFSTRRYAASTRSRARPRSTRLYCRGSGRVRFFRGDGRPPNARWISPRLTPFNFFVTSPSLRASGSCSDAGHVLRMAAFGGQSGHSNSRASLQLLTHSKHHHFAITAKVDVRGRWRFHFIDVSKLLSGLYYRENETARSLPRTERLGQSR